MPVDAVVTAAVPVGGERSEHDETLGRLKGQFILWEDVCTEEIREAQTDRDYYDGLQWTPEQVAELNARNQPPIAFNRVAPKLNYLLGAEITTRGDPEALPRSESHWGDSDAGTDILRYHCDRLDYDEIRTLSAENVCIEGLGAMVFSINADSLEDATDFSVHHVPHDRIFRDPFSRWYDCRDANFMGVIAWMPIEQAKARWNKEHHWVILESSKSFASRNESTEDRPRWWRSDQKRVQILEHFWRDYDPETGRIEWFEAVWVAGGFLEEPRRVEFIDDSKGTPKTWCPMIVSAAYIKKGTPDRNERYGVVRNIRAPQDEINHRRSKGIHLMNVPARVVAETGAIKDPQRQMESFTQAGGYLEVEPGRLGDGSIHIVPNTELSAAQMNASAEAKAEIDQVGPSPIPIEQGGSEPSGRLYLARQEAGAQELKPVFDHINKLDRAAYRRMWWLSRLIMTEEEIFRVRDEDDAQGYRFSRINYEMTRGERLEELLDRGEDLDEAIKHAFGLQGFRMLKLQRKLVEEEAAQAMMQAQQQMQIMMQQSGMPPGMPPPPELAAQMPKPPSPEEMDKIVTERIVQSPLGQQRFRYNDVAALDIDIVINRAPNSPIVEYEQAEKIMSMVQQGQIQLPPEKSARLVLEVSSLRNKKRLLSMVEEPPPREQLEYEKQVKEIALAKAQAEVAKLQAEAAKAQAEAQLASIRAQAGEPAAALLDQAQAGLAQAKTEATSHEAELTQAQTVKTGLEAGRMSEPQSPVEGAPSR